MKKAIQIDLTKYTEEQILANAVFRGYQEQVEEITTEDLTNEDGEVVETKEIRTLVDNPQAPADFLAERAKEEIDAWLSERMIRETRQAKRQEEVEAIETIKSDIAKTTEVIDL